MQTQNKVEICYSRHNQKHEVEEHTYLQGDIAVLTLLRGC